MTVLSRLTSDEVPIEEIGEGYRRVDIEFEGVDHSGSSYEARVFVNNPEADGDTERTAANGYVGSYYVFGHGGCYGDQGHCEVRPRAPYDPRPPHGLLPIKKVVTATNAIKAAAGPVRVTVVPVLAATTDKVPEDEALPQFESMSVIAYR
jgi:hypothetical protein